MIPLHSIAVETITLPWYVRETVRRFRHTFSIETNRLRYADGALWFKRVGLADEASWTKLETHDERYPGTGGWMIGSIRYPNLAEFHPDMVEIG